MNNLIKDIFMQYFKNVKGGFIMAVVSASVYDDSNKFKKDRVISALEDVITEEINKDIQYCILLVSDDRCNQLESLIVPRSNFKRLLEIYKNELDDSFRYLSDSNRVIEGWAFVTNLSNIRETLDAFM